MVDSYVGVLFLIQGIPLFLSLFLIFQHRDESEALKKPNKGSQKANDEDRQFKDEGVWPQFHGSYHMYHYIDVSFLFCNSINKVLNTV